MSNAAKLTDIAGASLPRTSDQAAESDVLHFLTRTLQAHFLDAEPHDMLAKLRNLKNALEQQEVTLSDWPDSPSKDRICEALAKAKNLVTQIIDEFGTAAARPTGVANVKAL